MNIEIIVGGLVVIGLVAYFLLKKDANDTDSQPEQPFKDFSDVGIAQSSLVAKKPAKKKAEKVDLDSMKKSELLAHAKAKGVKANASMNKDALIQAIKNG